MDSDVPFSIRLDIYKCKKKSEYGGILNISTRVTSTAQNLTSLADSSY